MEHFRYYDMDTTTISAIRSSQYPIKLGKPEHGTAEHGTPAEQRNSGGATEHYPEHQRKTPEYRRNTHVTPV